MCLLLLWGQTAPILGNPTGGSVASGKASIGTSGSTETISQTSRDAIINWQTFSINSGETTKFLVPNSSSATLNRVMGGNASAIYGSLQSNGKIILINPNGILIGPTGRIDTASFLGSTLDVTDADFLKNGNLHFVGTGGSIENDGMINASNGDVYLLAPQVTNTGSITAAKGTAGLGAGTDILLRQKGDQHLFIQPGTASSARATGVTQCGTIQSATAELKAAGGNAYALAINNSGAITATGFKKVGGQVFLTADTGALTNSGTIRATSGKSGGVINLASLTGTITNSGTLDASATGVGQTGGSVMMKSASGSVINTAAGQLVTHGGSGGQGGQVEMSGGAVQALGLVDTTSVDGKTGMFTIDPATFTVAASGGDETGSQVDAMLATTDVTLNADNAVTINDAITWTSGNTLTLSTNTAGSVISINSAITGTNGGLTLASAAQGDSITAAGAVDVARFNLQSGSWRQNTSTLPAFTANANFDVQNGATFLRATGGNGTTGSPYQITDVYGLQGLGSTSLLNSSAQLENVIDASDTLNWNSGAGFVPIGSGSSPYTGTFNGQGNVVDGLFIGRSSTTDVGLFGVASGTLENVGLEAATIVGGTDTGGLVGALGNDAGGTAGTGTITDCFVNGTVVGGDYVGGLTGLDHGTSISQSYSGGSVQGDDFVGGLVGSGLSAISNSYSTSSVNGGGPVGGLEGENYYGGSITDCYSSGSVVGTSEIGGFVGRNLGGNITGGLFDYQTSGQTASVGSGSTTGITADTTATLLQESTYTAAGWNIGTDLSANTWVIFDGDTRPMLAMEYNTTITNAHQLQLIGLNSTTLTSNYTVGTNVDLSGTQNAADVWGTSVFNGGKGFVPIGTYDGDSDAAGVVYHGLFDGGNFAMSNLYIDRPSEDSVGLFGDAGHNTTLENINLTNVNVTGSVYTGGLVGVDDSTIYNDSVQGNVTGGTYVGGLLGIVYANVTTSYSTGTVTGTSGGSDVGGFVGYVQGGAVDSCYSTATVSAGNSAAVGGFAGVTGGVVSNVFSTGNVSGGSDVGGLAGEVGGTLSTSYTASHVSGSSAVGGLAGANYGTITQSFWDTSTAGVTQGVSNDASDPNVIGATTAQLMSQSYILSQAPSWNFTTVWSTNGDTTLPELQGVGGPGGTVAGNTGTNDNISGTIYIDPTGTTNADDVTLDFIFDGMLLGTTTTDSSGAYTFSVNSNDLTGGLLITDAADAGNTFYQANAPASTITGVNVYGLTLTLQADAASNSALKTAAGSLTGDGINYSVTGSNLTTHTGVSVQVLDNYTLDGNVTSTGAFTTGANAMLLGSTASTVTSGVILLKGDLDRTGATTFVSTAGDIELENVGTSGAPAVADGLTLTSSRGVILDNSFLNTNGGNFSATGTGYTSTTDSADTPDGIDLIDSAVNAGGGNITITGSGGYIFVANSGGLIAGYGVFDADSTLTTSGSDNITVSGTFDHNITVAATRATIDGFTGNQFPAIAGCEIIGDGSTTNFQVGSGTISVTGNVLAGTTSGQGDDARLYGVRSESGIYTATANGGSISINGNASGGTMGISGDGTSPQSSNGAGVSVVLGNTLTVASGGSVTFTGTGPNIDLTSGTTGASSVAPFTTGIIFDGTISTGNSTVSMTGTGGSVTTESGFTGDSYGVYLNGCVVDMTGGSMSFVGHGGAVNAGTGENSADATSVGIQDDGAALTLNNGTALSFTGTGGNLDASQAGTLTGNVGAVSRGVLIFDGAEVEGTGSTPVTITGTGGNITFGSTLTGGSLGVDFGGNGDGIDTVISSDASLTVTGTGGSAPALGDGVLANAFDGGELDITSAGALTITGTGGAGYTGDGTIDGNAVPNFGVAILDNVHLTSGGALAITGHAGANSQAVDVEELPDGNVFDDSPTLPDVNAAGGLTVTATAAGINYDGTASSNYTATFITPGSSSSTIENAGGPYVLNGGNFTLDGNSISLSTGTTGTIGTLDVTSSSSIALGRVNATAVTLNCDTESDITQTGVLDTGTLTVTSAGDIELGNTGNSISTLDGISSDGDINIYTASALTVAGDVSGFGTVTLQAHGGNLVLGANSSISDDFYNFLLRDAALHPDSVANGQAVNLVTNKNFINNSDLGGEVIDVGGGANYYIYSSGPKGTVLNGIPVDFTLYNTAYPDTNPPPGNGVIYAGSSTSGGGGGGGTGTGTGGSTGTLADGGTPVPPAIVPQNDQIAPQEPSSGIQVASNDPDENPGYSTTGNGIFTQTAATSNDLANFYGNSGQIGADDAAQLNDGELNNVSDPAASNALDDALSPAVRSALAVALADLHFVEDNNATDPGTSNTANEQVIGSDDVVEIGGGQVKHIPLSEAPQPLQDALGSGVMNGLRPGAGR